MSWRTHEWIAVCATCATTTPHSRRRFGTWLIVAIAFVAVVLTIAIWNRPWPGGTQLVVIACALLPLLLAAGVVHAARGRTQDWNGACDRCRNRSARRADPRSTEIHPF